jgi:hypothetical protein
VRSGGRQNDGVILIIVIPDSGNLRGIGWGGVGERRHPDKTGKQEHDEHVPRHHGNPTIMRAGIAGKSAIARARPSRELLDIDALSANPRALAPRARRP